MSKLILLVDDDRELLDVTEAALKKREYDVICAENGVRALHAISQRRPDLILTDVLMPEMDGFQFYKELKHNPQTKDIPVLIVTGRGKMEDSFKVLGVDGFIAKPFTIQDLVAEMEHIFLADNSRARVGLPTETRRGGRRVLAVSSQPYVVANMQQQARQAGFELLVVPTAAEAIARCVKFIPEITVIDIGLSDMTAGELTDILRRLPMMETRPVIGFCYYPSEELQDTELRRKILGYHDASRRMLEAGATEYIGRYSHQLFLKAVIDHTSAKQSHHG
jgi:CheY-like chemotaxis protein